MAQPLTLVPLPTRREAMARARARGMSIVATLPYHYPRALLRAHGCHAMEVWGPPWASAEGGRRHFQPYACAIVLKAMAFLGSEGFEQVDAVLVPHGCDALQGLGSVLVDFVSPRPPVLTCYVPRAARPADRAFLAHELRALGTRLAEVTGRVPDRAAWEAAFEAEDAADRALADLYSRRERVALSDRAFHSLIRSREYLLAEDFVRVARGAPEGDPPRPGVGILLGGIVPEPMELFDRLNEAGAHVLVDDLSSGWRRLYPRSDLPDPHERMAARLLGGHPDPTRGTPLDERVGSLLRRMRASGATGMLLYTVKFCEPELFGVPRLRQALASAGVPFLHVEHELEPELSQHTLTRIEAFVESLR